MIANVSFLINTLSFLNSFFEASMHVHFYLSDFNQPGKLPTEGEVDFCLVGLVL